MRNKFLISGANGFIGMALYEYLLTRGHKVFFVGHELLINNEFGYLPLQNHVEKINPDFIIHLAAYGNHSSQTNNLQILESNIIGTYNLLMASLNCEYKKFYNFSSSSVTLKKQTFYSVSKLAAENIVNLIAENYGKPIVNIRPYSVYGPGEAEWRFIPTVIRALGNGEEIILDKKATHDWIFIDDLIRALFAGHTEIGTGESHTNLQVVEMLQNISGKKLKYKPGTLREYDNEEWVCKSGVAHLALYNGLKKTYESITSKNNSDK